MWICAIVQLWEWVVVWKRVLNSLADKKIYG